MQPHAHRMEPAEWTDADGASTGMRCATCGVRRVHYQQRTDSKLRLFYNDTQRAVLQDHTSPTILLASGFGGGKTWTEEQFVIDRVMSGPPGTQGIIVEPNYTMTSNILERGSSSVFWWLKLRGVPYGYNHTKHYISLPGDRGISLLSADHPDSLAGSTVAVVAIDEAAFVDRGAFEQLSMRCRDPSVITPQLLCASTHDGANTWFAAMIAQGKHTVVRGTSLDNFVLPDSYLERQRTLWPVGTPEHDMYVLGIPRILSGNAYRVSAANFRQCINPDAGNIVIGGDFNEHYMVSVIGRYLRGELHIWGEVVTRGEEHADTTTRVHYEAVRTLLEARGYAIYHTGAVRQVRTSEQIEAHIDASSTAQKTSAENTDEHLVREVGFWTVHDPANPPVRDRRNSVQAAFHDRRLFIDEDGAPVTARAVREQDMDPKTGQPRKHKGPVSKGAVVFDAHTDSVGYLVWNLMPLRDGVSLVHGRR